MLRNFLLSALFAILPAEAAGPPEAAGRVEFVTGDAQFIDATQQVRRPTRGDLLRASDTIVTGSDGEVHLDMGDGGYLAVRPNTRLNVKAYRAHGDKGDHVLLYLLKGTFRSFTGWIPNVAPKGYLTETITATIGVRGTDHEPLFIPKDSDIGEPGTYDKVNEGATYIDHASGRIDVLPNTAGFAPLSPGGTARLLERVPDFFRPSPNENLLAGRHKLVQDHLQERLDARRRLNQWPTDDAPGEMQEAPTAPKGTDIRDAPDSSRNLPGVPAVPAAVPAADVSATPASAAVPGVSPASVAAPAAAAGTAAAAGAGAAAKAGAAAVPGTASAVTPAASAVSPAAAAVKAPAASPPAIVPADKEKSSPTVAPKEPERRSVSGKPRGVPDASRSIDEKPRPKVIAPTESEREKAYNERRRKQQQDHQDQYERDRDIEHERDLDRERDAEREAAKRSKEQR